MLARKRKNARLNRPELIAAKATLRARGWTYRAAAPACNVTFEHFAKVLSGMRESEALLNRISTLPSLN